MNLIKTAIEKALQKALQTKSSLVFLDSEALGWGDEWSAKIHNCIDNAKILVFLASPNYLRSSYCQREKLWWQGGKSNLAVGFLHIKHLNQ